MPHGDVVENITLHEESFVVSPAARHAMDRAKRVIAVGTTSVRAIESDWASPTTRLFLYPGATFQRTGAMLTNFHLPKSSLLILICAFAGKDLALAAYRHAVEQEYRFFSYGDCMLIF
jgi:S-adenosylmethionine:tRNA ribosyltransferase-isomerase